MGAQQCQAGWHMLGFYISSSRVNAWLGQYLQFAFPMSFLTTVFYFIFRRFASEIQGPRRAPRVVQAYATSLEQNL